MKQLFLSPRSNETAYANFKSSLAEGVSVSKLMPFLTTAQKEILAEQEFAFVWGAQRSKEDTWNKMEIGDYVLFYSHYLYVQAAEIQIVLESEKLALSLWPKSKDTGEAWSCLYIVKNLRNIHLPIAEFNQIAGYNMEYLRGLQRVTDEHLFKIIATYGNLDTFIETITVGLKDHQVGELNKLSQKDTDAIDPTELEKIDTIFGERDPDDVLAELSARNLEKAPAEKEIQTKRIIRDYRLVKAIKEKYNNRCQICNFTFKTSKGTYYSEAAHIKAISNRTKGIDVAENLLVLCPNHHKMLDYGAIEVLSNKELVIDGKTIRLA